MPRGIRAEGTENAGRCLRPFYVECIMKILARIIAGDREGADAIARELKAMGYETHISEDEIVDWRDGADLMLTTFMEATKEFAADVVTMDEAMNGVANEVHEVVDCCYGAMVWDWGDAEGYLKNPWDEPWVINKGI
jgi:hypothetical protein